MKRQKVMVAVPLEEELLGPLHHWGKKFDWSHVDEVHFVHIVKKNITPLEFGLMELPDENTYREMIPTLERFLQEEARKILPQDYHGKKDFHLYSSYHPEEEINSVIKKVGADVIVVSTRGKHGFEGLFHSSFTDHMVKFAPCDVFVVRPESPDFRASA